MKEIKDIIKEIKNNSSGCFKNKEGDIYYLLNGRFHRLNGPAIEYTNNSKLWYINGKLHRNDGPAITLGYGDKFWYYYNYKASKEEFHDPEWRRKIEIKVFL